MVTLRDKMECFLDGWKADLPEEWQALFEDVDPRLCAARCCDEIEDHILVFPGRQNENQKKAPKGAHLCRAFDDIKPNNVRVVVLGQDPYPSISSATGRAFEDGADVNGDALRPALRNLALSALDLIPRAARPGFFHGRDGRAAAIQGYFNRLAGVGVLFVNTAWTYTHQDHKNYHRGLWRPVTSHLLRSLAERQNHHVVFLLLGNKAKTVFSRLRLAQNDRVRVVQHAHPTRGDLYFQGVNPLEIVNQNLRCLGDETITWWANTRLVNALTVAHYKQL